MGFQQLRIFMFHNIGTPPAAARLQKLYVDADTFERQCRLLQRLGLRGVSMSEGLQGLRTGGSNRLVVLTFDDGYADTVEYAGPILQRFGFHATCYVVAAAIGSYNIWDADVLSVRKPIMNRIDIGRWLAAGHEIGSHTITHPILTRIDRAHATSEIVESRRQLQELTGTAVEHFCYPYGEHDDRVVDMVREAGYESAVTTRRGPALPDTNLLRLPRIAVNRGQSLFKFGLHAATRYSWLRRQ